MKNSCYLLLFLFVAVFGRVEGKDVLSEKTLESLRALDSVVQEKDFYRLECEKSLARLKSAARTADEAGRIAAYKELFQSYSRMQTDSAWTYLDRLEELQRKTGDGGLRNYLHIGRAGIYAVTGLYAEALEELGKVFPGEMDDDMRLYYFRERRTVYGWMKTFAVARSTRERMHRLTERYRDSILMMELEGVSRDIVLADKALANHRPEEALDILLKDLPKVGEGDRVYVLFNLAEAYRQSGDTDRRIYYLSQAAIADLKAGVTEYEALPQLAQLLYERGDVERAYSYLICSMEDANYCKARLRTVEASTVFPIIDRAYKQNERKFRRVERVLLYVVVAVVLLLVAVIVFLRRQKRRLSQTQQELARANRNLQEANGSLLLTDKVKEEYIARYLDRCRGYIDTLETYRRTLLKLVKAHQTDELYKQLKSESLVANEQARFYADFDSAFLTLFPHFVENFNALLEPESRVKPKNGELLNTELRIFALIRLGVKDSARIAHFLDYSLATIYNYRSKFRNKAVCGKAEFEQRVMEL